MIEPNQEIRSYPIPPALKAIIPGYLDRRNQDILQLKLAVEQNDFQTIGVIAHKLKGNGASYGFIQLTEIGKKLMHSSETKNQLMTRQLISEFESELSSIKSSIP